MSQIQVSFILNASEYSHLKMLKKSALDTILKEIFKIGYDIYFPPKEYKAQQVELNTLFTKLNNFKDEIKDEINNSATSEKITCLESSLSKLIGLSSNSCKKGNFGENVLEEIFNQRYGDIQFERKSNTPHSGDAWLYLPDNKIIMLESKNYTTVINKDEINKLQSDMITHHIKWGVLASFNSNIQGMKELDFHTFLHNSETYGIIMISNLSTDIHKLDLGLQIIRKLIVCVDNLEDFPWVVSDITNNLNELNQIIQKNYILRDTFYTMEKDIYKLLDGYHVHLRNYQYEIEMKINEIINKIKSTITASIELNKEPDMQSILQYYQDKKILPLLPLITRLIDIIQQKKWNIEYDLEELYEWKIIDNTDDANFLFDIKIQRKKIIITTPDNVMTLVLNLNKDAENHKVFDIIQTFNF
jgi:hypothetical protein